MNLSKFFLVPTFLFFSFVANAEYRIELDSKAPNEVETFKTSFLSYYFGSVWTNSMNTVRYNVTNTGTVPLDFSRASISGPHFDAIHTCGGTIFPQQGCWFEIRYWPAFEGQHSGRFVLSFAQEETIVVDVWGQARRP